MDIQLTLPALAERINVAHEQCLALAKGAVLGFIEVGRLLVEAKGQVQHGEWAGWIEANCIFGIREAQRYMRAYDHREALEEQMRHGMSHLTGLGSAMEALSLPVAKAPEGGPDSGPKRVPITEVSPEDRHWLCAQWWDVRAHYTMMLDAAGWDAGDIADFLGRPTEDIEAILDPQLPVRLFDVWEDGCCLVNDHTESQAPEHYRDCVAYVIDGWLTKACWAAGIECERDGFGEVGPILRDRERQYRRRREMAERRGISTYPYWYADEKPRKDSERAYSGFAASLALQQCVLADARHAVRIDVQAEQGRWSADLMEMWIRHFQALEEPLEKILSPSPAGT
jgi:hypothetical protein